MRLPETVFNNDLVWNGKKLISNSSYEKMETGQSRSWVPPPKDKSPFSGIIRSAMLFPAMSRATAVSVLERGVVTAVAGRNTTADRQHHSSQQQPPHHSQQRAVSHRSAGSVLSSEMAAKLVSCHRDILDILSLRPCSSCQIIAEKYFYANSRVKWYSGDTGQA